MNGKGGQCIFTSFNFTAVLLFLIIFSSTELVSTAQSEMSVEYAYVPNELSNTVSVINTTTNTVISTVPVGNNPCGVTINHDGTKVYVTNFGNDNARGNTFTIINTDTDEVITKLVYSGEGIKPFGVAITPDETLYIASYGTDKVYAINLTADYSTPINVGSKPLGVAITSNGKWVYVANRGSNSVSVINTITNNVTATVPVGSEPYGVAVSSDGNVYVTNQNSGNISVINTTTNTVIATVNVGVYPHGIAVTPNGKTVYVANHNPYCGTVSVINTTTYVTKNINVYGTPCGVTVTHDGKWVYVTTSGSENNSGSVLVINTTTNTVISKKVLVGTRPSALGQFIGSIPGSKVETMTTLTSSSNQYSVGKPVTFTATVNATSQGTEKPSGVVTFTDGRNNININLNSGQAILDTSFLSIGSHSVIARYGGDNNFRPSTSLLTLTVQELSNQTITPTSPTTPPPPDPPLKRLLNYLEEFFNEIIIAVCGGVILALIKKKFFPK